MFPASVPYGAEIRASSPCALKMSQSPDPAPATTQLNLAFAASL